MTTPVTKSPLVAPDTVGPALCRWTGDKQTRVTTSTPLGGEGFVTAAFLVQVIGQDNTRRWGSRADGDAWQPQGHAQD